MKKSMNWQFVYYFEKEPTMIAPCLYRFEIGLIKLHTMPSEGQYISRKDYKGFLLRTRLFIPIEII